MKFKFEQLAEQILNEGNTAKDHERFKKDQFEHELGHEDRNQPYKIRITWKSGGKSFLKAGEKKDDVVYIGTSGYYKAQMKAVSLKSNNPKIAEADVFAV